MKQLLPLLALAGAAQAAPILTADPYPAGSTQPDFATFTIDGGPAIACSLLDTPAGKVPICDLASIRTAGTYVLVMTVGKRPGSCTNQPNEGTCAGGSSASSEPFTYHLEGGSVPPPTVALAP